MRKYYRQAYGSGAIVTLFVFVLIGSSAQRGPDAVIHPALAHAHPKQGTTALSKADASTQARFNSAHAKLPLSFEANQGQADQRVRFLSRGAGYTLFLAANEASLQLRRGKQESTTSGAVQSLRMRLIGANEQAQTTGEDELAGKTNYFIGNDPAKWQTNVANFGRVHYKEIYKGVDLIFYGSGRELEYDFVINPKAEPRDIALEFAGATRVTVDTEGELVLQMGSGAVRQPKPSIYQEIDGRRRDVEGGYVVKDEHHAGASRVGFEVKDYDRSRPLIIDPVLSYATYLGGSGDDFGSAIALDSSGNAYVAGYTSSLDFPRVNPLQSTSNGQVGFVTKLNAAGTAFVYSTYLGFANTFINAIAVDANGNAYVAGLTGANNFPTTPGAFISSGPGGAAEAAGFVSKISANGSSLVYSTYIASPTTFTFSGGGSGDNVNAIGVDTQGNAYITGRTNETTFPTTTNAFHVAPKAASQKDVFVLKLNATGSTLLYSTFLGSGDTTNFTASTSLVIDASGNAYLTGQTRSNIFPVTTGAFQTVASDFINAFVTKVNPNGTGLVYSTYLGGGNESAFGSGIAIDSSGNAYVTGNTFSSNFPTTVNAFSPLAGFNSTNTFLTKLNASGTALIYSTYLTPVSGQNAVGVALGSDNSAFVAIGSTGSIFPVNAAQPNYAGGLDAAILKVNPAGAALSYETFLGGSGFESGAAIAVDGSSNAYVTGNTTSTNFPVTSGAAQTTIHSTQDSFVAKIGAQTNDCPAITINPQPLPIVVPGQPYLQQLTATGGPAPYTFSLVNGLAGGNLPPGLALAADGTLAGTPPPNTVVRDYPLIVQAVASNGCVGMRAFNLSVRTVRGRNARFYMKVVSRPIIRIGNEYTFFILYANRSDTDAINVPLVIKVPNYVSAHPKFDQPFQTTQQGDSTLVSLTLPKVPAHSDTSGLASLPILVKVLDPNRAHNKFRMLSFIPAPDKNVNVTVYGPDIDGGDDGGGDTDPQTPNDPNEKSGSGGIGAPRYYTGDVALPYVVTFENTDTASLPAQDVVVNDQLDPNVFDLSTFSFGLIAFGDRQVMAPLNAKQYTTDVDLRPAKQAIVRVSGNLDTNTGLVNWQFHTLDPTTGKPPEDPQAGFLPPNKTSPEGQGTILFTVKAKPGLPTGTVVNNNARITFDVNAPIDTGLWTNTIDNSKPSSSVQSLPSTVPYSFVVSWSGTDTGSGIATYTINASDNGSAFTPWLVNATSTGAVFTGQNNHSYRFYSIARDAVGNEEAAKTSGEATTTVNSPANNPLDDPTFFVSQHYRDFLGREPDAGGFGYWTSQITQCGTGVQCIRNKRIDVSNAFFFELEFQQTDAYVYRLYRVAFGNNQPFPNPDNSNQTEAKKLPSYAVFARDRVQVVGGANLAQGQQDLANAFVQSKEFLAKYTAADGPSFVDAVLATVNNDLGVDLTSQRAAFINLFNSGGRGGVMYRLADDNAQTNPINNRALIDAGYNRAFVTTQYFGYLRRDADIGGFLFWLGQVNGGPLRDATKQHAMVCSFITSAEYQLRFSSVVTHSNAECPQ